MYKIVVACHFPVFPYWFHVSDESVGLNFVHLIDFKYQHQVYTVSIIGVFNIF